MHVVRADIPDVLILEPKIFGDQRGYFMEAFNARDFAQVPGLEVKYVQDNQSRSMKGVVRGLHYQIQLPQGKLIRVISGEIFDVAVDLRRSSASFGKHVAMRLSAENPRTLYIPPGFAHGFLVLSGTADVLYKTTDYYAPEHERTLLWNDPALGISWPMEGISLILSEKDKKGLPLGEAETFA